MAARVRRDANHGCGSPASLLLISLLLLTSACSNYVFFPDSEQRLTPDRIGLEYEPVTIESADGTLLNAWWLPARGERKGSVLFLHGNAENISSHIASVHWLPARGYDVLLPDYRGYGDSGGYPDLAGAHSDALAALEALLARPGVEPENTYVFGQSLGGAIAVYTVAASRHRGRLGGLIIEGAFADYPEIAREIIGRAWFGVPFAWPVSLLMGDYYSPKRWIGDVSPAPLLIVHSEQDQVIPVHHARTLYQRACEPKERWIEPTGAHIAVFTEEPQRKRLVSWMAAQTDRERSDVPPAAPPPDLKAGWKFGPFPIIFSSPESGVGFGAGGAVTYRKPGLESGEFADSAQLIAIYTTKNQFLFFFVPELFLFDHRLRLKTEVGYMNYPDAIWGVGPDTPDEAEETFTREEFSLRPWVHVRLWKNLWVGGVAELRRISVRDEEEGGLIDHSALVGAEGGRSMAIGPTANWDTRDSNFYPTEGGLYRYYGAYYRDALGSDWHHHFHRLDLRQYVGLGHNLVLALQLYGGVREGNVPFFDLEQLGAPTLRGIVIGRFNDKSMLAGQVELRWRWADRWGSTFFAGMGEVAPELDEFEADDWKYSFGGGIYYTLIPEEMINLRFEFGWSPWGASPYINLMQAF